MTEVCVKIKQSGSSWVPDEEYPWDGAGCYFSFFSQQNFSSTAKYSISKPMGLKVFVRSSNDPLLTALVLSGGTLDFGTQQARVIASITLIVIGALCSCCWLVVFFWCWIKIWCSSGEEEVDSPSTNELKRSENHQSVAAPVNVTGHHQWVEPGVTHRSNVQMSSTSYYSVPYSKEYSCQFSVTDD